MRKELIDFLREVMRRRGRLPSQLAADIGVSHATVYRWLTGKDIPSIRSCQALSEYSGESLQKVLWLAGHVTQRVQEEPDKWPEFGEYARRKYPKELNEDLVVVIERLIDRKRGEGLKGV